MYVFQPAEMAYLLPTLCKSGTSALKGRRNVRFFWGLAGFKIGQRTTAAQSGNFKPRLIACDVSIVVVSCQRSKCFDQFVKSIFTGFF